MRASVVVASPADLLRTRTHLTTPPGGAPVTEANDRGSFELYTAGLQLPQEPKVAGRFRKQVVLLVILAVVAVVGFVAFQVATAGQDFDPSLEENINPGEEFDPTIPLPDDAG